MVLVILTQQLLGDEMTTTAKKDVPVKEASRTDYPVLPLGRSYPELRNAYSVSESELGAGISDFGPSLAKQEFKEECDINTIMRKFGVTGVLPAATRMPQYGDFENAMDFQESMLAITAARESFMAMPADVRYEFANDPQRFLEFCSDPKNAERASKLGLVKTPFGVSPAGSATPPKGEPSAASGAAKAPAAAPSANADDKK